jgi:hypothetical protein
MGILNFIGKDPGPGGQVREGGKQHSPRVHRQERGQKILLVRHKLRQPIRKQHWKIKSESFLFVYVQDIILNLLGCDQ